MIKKFFFRITMMICMIAAIPVFAANYIVTFDNRADVDSIVQLYKNDILSPPVEHVAVIKVTNESRLAALKLLRGVRSVEAETFFPNPQKLPSTPLRPTHFFASAPAAMPYALTMIHAPEAWTVTRGRGARVMVIDSGADVTHPALVGPFEKGQNFFEDRTNRNDVTDSVGHGTHVAGVIASVAPESKLLVARVCSLEKCSSAAIAQALAWALQEKVDVVNMSLGGGFTAAEKWMMDQLDSARIPVVAATGNSGTGDIGFPAAFASATAVGAVDQNGTPAAFSNWGPALDVMAPGVSIRSSVPRGTGRESFLKVRGASIPCATYPESAVTGAPIVAELVDLKLGRAEDVAGRNLAGKTALIQKGEIAMIEKVRNAQMAGAKAVVIFNNAPGLQVSSLSESGALLQVPIVLVEQTTGEAFIEALARGESPAVSLQVNASDYTELTGTSMAAPFVAGVVALMRSTKPNLSSWRIREILNQTASPIASDVGGRSGHGLVDAAAAVNESLRF